MRKLSTLFRMLAEAHDARTDIFSVDTCAGLCKTTGLLFAAGRITAGEADALCDVCSLETRRRHTMNSGMPWSYAYDSRSREDREMPWWEAKDARVLAALLLAECARDDERAERAERRSRRRP